MDDLIEELLENLGVDGTDYSDGELNIANLILEDSGTLESVTMADFENNLSDEMDKALTMFNDHSMDLSTTDSINFTGTLHHTPFEGEPIDSRSDISFEGSGDKYTDNEYNRKAADKWFAKEKDCLAKGDVNGAAAAHSTAMDHLKRIK